jgi:hypothetical protein
MARTGRCALPAGAANRAAPGGLRSMWTVSGSSTRTSRIDLAVVSTLECARLVRTPGALVLWSGVVDLSFGPGFRGSGSAVPVVWLGVVRRGQEGADARRAGVARQRFRATGYPESAVASAGRAGGRVGGVVDPFGVCRVSWPAPPGSRRDRAAGGPVAVSRQGAARTRARSALALADAHEPHIPAREPAEGCHDR